MNKSFGAIDRQSKITAEVREAYHNDDRFQALAHANVNLARSMAAGLFGGDPIVPPSEFGGHSYMGGPYGVGGYMGGAGFGPGGGIGDIASWPGRYGMGPGGIYQGGYSYNQVGQNVDYLRIAQSMMLYKTEGVVQTIVHLLADFATEGLKVEHEDKSVANFFEAWSQKINLSSRTHRFIIDLLTSGQLFIWRKEAKLKDSEKLKMKRGQAQVIAGELYDDRFRAIGDLTRDVPKGTKIPWGYISLNPLQMALRGSRFAGDHYWVMLLNRDDVTQIKKHNKNSYHNDLGDTEVNLPNEIKGQLKILKGGGVGKYTHEIQLDADRLTVLHDNTKADYEAWATPSIYPAYKEIMVKRLMRAGELSALESMKHMITLLKLGDVKEGLAPTREALQRVASAVAAGSQAHYLIWDDLIEGEVLQPDIGKILDPKKYESIDKDIFMALGVSETVMAGKGSYANSFLSIKLLLERLESIREKIMEWLMFELKIITERMGFRKMPRVRFGLMNLRDENAERKLLTDLFDRGIVSQETFLEFFDLDYNHERIRQISERNNIKKDNDPEEGEKDVFGTPKSPVESPVMMPTGPFRKGDKPQPPKGFGEEPKPFSGKNGRPNNSGKPQEKKRNTKPRGMSQLIKYDHLRQFSSSCLPVVQKCVSEYMCQLHDVPDVRSLDKTAKEALDHLVFMVMAHVSPNVDVTDNLVYNTLGIVRTNKATAASNPVYQNFCRVAPEFNTKAEARDGFCTIYAAVHSGMTEEIDEVERNPTEDSNLPREGATSASHDSEDDSGHSRVLD